jgi:hypothetical protein
MPITKEALERFLAWLNGEGLTALVEAHECGWLDGGCWSLAEGIRRALGDEVATIWTLCNGRLKSEHVVAAVGPYLFLDANGLGDDEAIYAYWAEEEGITGPHLVAGPPAPGGDLQLFEEIADLVAQALRAALAESASLEVAA